MRLLGVGFFIILFGMELNNEVITWIYVQNIQASISIMNYLLEWYKVVYDVNMDRSIT